MPKAEVLSEVEVLLSKEDMTREDIRKLRALVLSDYSSRERVEERLEGLEAGEEKMKLASALLALGRFDEASKAAGPVRDGVEARLIEGMCAKALGDEEGAMKAFEAILAKEPKALDIMLEIGDLKRSGGDV